MPRPVRHLALLVSLVLAGLTTGCSGDTEPSAAPPSAPQRPATVTYGVPADVVTMVLPTTGRQSRATQGLDAFGKLAAARALSRCAGVRGEQPPDGRPPMFTRFADLPDLDYLRAHGFGGAVLVPGATTTGPSASVSPPTPRTLERCGTEARVVTRELRDIYMPLQSEWFARVARLRSDPKVNRAYRSFSACLARNDVDAADERAFFALADQRLQAADPAGTRKLSTVYVTCMKPVEDVREPLRKVLGRRFRATHRSDIATVRVRLPSKLRELETRYGIRFPVPRLQAPPPRARPVTGASTVPSHPFASGTHPGGPNR
ncbi:hypothetical protein [Streptomyces sp. 1222.5]|uniref:hypothetical protein n=1 Tax=Streptomyces sp. 1222.5 TaxID=1881026 RepID=UPI003EB7A7B9